MNKIERQNERDKKVVELEKKLQDVIEKLDLIIAALVTVKKGKK